MFIPTLREDPAQAELASQRLLIRAGFIRKHSSGVWSYLPLGRRTLLKIIGVVREEMNAAGIQEFFLPAPGREQVPPPSGNKSSTVEGQDSPELRAGAVESTEAAFMEIARGEIRSYKQLPQIWYCIQRGSRQGLVMSSSSFSASHEGPDHGYRVQYGACRSILARCGVRYVTAAGSTEIPEDSESREFMVPTEAGEDLCVTCSSGHAANLKCATSLLPEIIDPEELDGPREVPTPGQKTIADVAGFLGAPATHQIKSLVYVADDKISLLLLRGDHQLSEAKAAAALKAASLRPARPEEIREAFGADAGSLGPLGIKNMAVYSDLALKGRRNLTCGANRNDYHTRGVTPDLHFRPIWADLRTVEGGEACATCGGPLEIVAASTVARLGGVCSATSKNAHATVLAPDGTQAAVVVAHGKIDIEKMMFCAVELLHDQDGIVWPASIAPFTAVITPVSYRDAVKAAADRLYEDLGKAGVEVLLDDREARPGVKFKDADLIGIPFRVVLGPEKVKQNQVELFSRSARTTEVVGLDCVVPVLQAKLDSH